jgi:CubicO group peptidase (beta-lactamase class C family)
MNKSKKIIFSILLVAILASTGIGIVAVVNITKSDGTIDSRIQGIMSEGNVPSLSAGIIINNSLVWSKGYGEQPDGIDSVYMIGSITKVFTSTSIMQLYDNGSLDLDTDIDNYLPFNVSHPSYPGTPITTRMLLSHTSGMGHPDIPSWYFDADFINWINNNLGWNLTAWDPRPTLGEFLNGSLNPAGSYYKSENWINFLPGTSWQYSNFGMLLLAYIVEQLTNQSYVEYLQENILDPLDMTSTGFNYTDFVGRNAIPYEQADTQLIEGPLYNNYGIGDGGLRSTVPDLAKFLIAHMNLGTYNNSQILQPQTVDLMQTSQISLYGHELGGYSFSGQGLGWGIYTENIIGHGGATAGYLANMAYKTVSNGKYGIVVMLNKGSSFVHDSDLINNIFPSIIETLFDEAARRFNL